ncbi:MAG: enolase C-terminal domain-like protein [Desulfobacterales bacterium]
MRITEVCLYRLAIPFRLPVSHSLAERKQAEGIVVIARGEDGACGYGEGTPRHYVTGETLEGCLDAARELGHLVVGRAVDSVGGLFGLLRELGATPAARLFPSALCATEIACLDLWGREIGLPVSGIFEGGGAQSYTYSAVLPLLGDDLFDRFLDLTAENRMGFVKIKVGAGVERDLERIRRARTRLGETVDIRVDANGGYSPNEALDFLGRSRGLMVSAIEQPVPKGDLDGMKRVSDEGGVLVIADESLCSIADAERIVAARACRGFNVRLSKCGGFLKSLAIWDLASQNGIACQIGSHVGETGILAAAGRHLATVRPDRLYLEGSFSRRLLAEDLVVEDVDFGPKGHARALCGPGLGIAVAESNLSRLGVLVHRVT